MQTIAEQIISPRGVFIYTSGGIFLKRNNKKETEKKKKTLKSYRNASNNKVFQGLLECRADVLDDGQDRVDCGEDCFPNRIVFPVWIDFFQRFLDRVNCIRNSSNNLRACAAGLVCNLGQVGHQRGVYRGDDLGGEQEVCLGLLIRLGSGSNVERNNGRGKDLRCMLCMHYVVLELCTAVSMNEESEMRKQPRQRAVVTVPPPPFFFMRRVKE